MLRFNMKYLLCGLTILACLGTRSQCTTTTTLSTTYNTNNASRGAMFDITAASHVTIDCFSSSLITGTTANYEIYYKAGTFVGSETNAAAWTLIGTTTALTSGGFNVSTYIPINVNVLILAGQTYGFYVTNTSGGGTAYTDGIATNALLASDASISVNGGVGKTYPFGLTFNNRYFNGDVHYSPATVLPIELASFSANNIAGNVVLNWTTLSEINSDYFIVERSESGVSWKQIGSVDASENSSREVRYSFTDDLPLEGKAFYRLKSVDKDGRFSYTNPEKINIESNNALRVFPNPANSVITIESSANFHGSIRIFNSMGNEVKSIQPDSSKQSMTLDINFLTPGLYFIKYNSTCVRFQVI